MMLAISTLLPLLFAVLISPLTSFALPLSEISNSFDASRNTTVLPRQLVYTDLDNGLLACVQTQNPHECTIRVAQYSFQSPFVEVFDPVCNSLGTYGPGGLGTQQTATHASIHSNLQSTVELDFNADWNVPPTGSYEGHPIGQQWNIYNYQWPICEGPWTAPPHKKIGDMDCILPFTC